MPGSAEFVVHHDAYHRLVEHFGAKRVVPEFYIPKHGRADLALMDEDGKKPLILIEVKPYESKRLTRRPRQCDRYEAGAGVPVVCVRGPRMAANIVPIVLGMLKP